MNEIEEQELNQTIVEVLVKFFQIKGNGKIGHESYDFHVKLKDDKGVYYDATIHMNLTLDEQMALKKNEAKKYQWILRQFNINNMRTKYAITQSDQKFSTKEEVEAYYPLDTTIQVIEPYLPSGE